MEPLIYGNDCRVNALMPYKGTPLIHGNPLCKEIQYKGKSRVKGTPLYKDINYTRKPLIHGNSCKVKCLIQQRGASPSESFREIKCTFEHIKHHRGKPKKSKEKKRSRGKLANTSRIQTKTKQNKQHKTLSDLCRPNRTCLKVVFCLFVWYSRCFLQVCPLTSLVLLVSLVSPMVVDVFKLLHCMFKHVPGNK